MKRGTRRVRRATWTAHLARLSLLASVARQRLLLASTVALASLAALLWWLPDDAFAGLYGRLLYPALTGTLTTLTEWAPVPLGIAVLPLATGLFLWSTLRPRPRVRAGQRILRVALLVLLLWGAYVVLWGANYRRPPLSEMLGLRAAPATAAELAELASYLGAWIAVEADSPVEPEAALASIAIELEGLGNELSWPAKLPRRLKPLPAGTLMRSGYAGMLFPLTLEPQYDSGLSAASRVSVGGHELAHVAGFASESDADLAAILAGLRSRHPYARYATALSLLARMLSSLPAEERAAVLTSLPPRARADLEDARKRSARYLNVPLGRRITAVYDRLLRGQGLTAGVAEYGRAPRLAAVARSEGLLPPLPALPQPSSQQPALPQPDLTQPDLPQTDSPQTDLPRPALPQPDPTQPDLPRPGMPPIPSPSGR